MVLGAGERPAGVDGEVEVGAALVGSARARAEHPDPRRGRQFAVEDFPHERQIAVADSERPAHAARLRAADRLGEKPRLVEKGGYRFENQLGLSLVIGGLSCREPRGIRASGRLRIEDARFLAAADQPHRT